MTFRIDNNHDGIYDYSTNLAYIATTALPVYMHDQATVSATLIDSVLVTSVPEPGALVLGLLGILPLRARRRLKF